MDIYLEAYLQKLHRGRGKDRAGGGVFSILGTAHVEVVEACPAHMFDTDLRNCVLGLKDIELISSSQLLGASSPW